MRKTISFFILFSMYAKAADQGLVTGDVQTDDKLNRMLAIPEVKKFYEGCSKNKTTNGKPGDISDCVWKQVSPNKTLKDQVLKAMKDPASTADSGKSLGSLPIAENFKTDPSIQKLSEIIGAKLEEALYGTPDPKDPHAKAAVDQQNFNKIYKAELNKTMVDAFLSYCLDTVDSTASIPINDEKDFQANRKKNSDAIRSDPITHLEPTKMLDGSTKPNKWQKCLVEVNQDCTDQKLNKSLQQRRACLVVQYVEAAKKNISVIVETDKFFDGLKGNRQQNAGPAEKFDPSKMSTLITVTSKEIDTAYKDTTEKSLDNLAECQKDGSEAKCKEFLNTKTNDNQKGLVEFNLHQEAEKEDFKDKIKVVNSEDDLKKFLLERGYKQEAIDKMDLNDWPTIKIEMDARYTNEKDALIAEMNKRIGDKTSKENGKTSLANDSGNLTKIQTELASRTENMKNLVMFNNVVSGFLEGTIVGGKDGNGARNTASLAAEINGNDENKDLKTKLEANGTKIPSSDSNGQSGDQPVSFESVGKLVDPAQDKQTTK